MQWLYILFLFKPAEMSLSKSMDKTWIELFSKEVHNAAVTILLVISIYVQHQGKLLHS